MKAEQVGCSARAAERKRGEEAEVERWARLRLGPYARPRAERADNRQHARERFLREERHARQGRRWAREGGEPSSVFDLV